jgi:hypothetical protein
MVPCNGHNPLGKYYSTGENIYHIMYINVNLEYNQPDSLRKLELTY